MGDGFGGFRSAMGGFKMCLVVGLWWCWVSKWGFVCVCVCWLNMVFCGGMLGE